MTDDEKIEWAKRAFGEISDTCESVAHLSIVDKIEKRAWRSVAAIARRNIKILEQE